MINYWRFLDTGPASGAFNMALDEAILLAHAEGTVPPTLRVYAWERPTLSLGYGQREPLGLAGEEDLADLLQRCREAGGEVVRRPTGGRAILHHLEVTYSIVVRASLLGQESSIIRSYRYLCRGIIAALQRLGVRADFADPGNSAKAQKGTQMCFALGSRCDLVAEGAKVVGSAQARRNGTILQHGSLPLAYDEALQTAIFGETFPRCLAEGRVMSLQEASQQPLTYRQVAASIKAGFATLFGSEPDRGGSVTREELSSSCRLEREKYSSLALT